MKGSESLKHELRQALRIKRRQLFESPAGRELCRRIQGRLLESELWTTCRTVVLYISVKEEPDTSLLLDAAWGSGREVFLPRCRPGRPGEMDMIACTGREALHISKFGIPEPELNAKSRLLSEAELREEDTLVVVPGLAFDRQGYRLGYGGGYYDRLLSRTACLSVGLIFGELFMQKLPRAVWDMPTRHVCTETELFGVENL